MNESEKKTRLGRLSTRVIWLAFLLVRWVEWDGHDRRSLMLLKSAVVDSESGLSEDMGAFNGFQIGNVLRSVGKSKVTLDGAPVLNAPALSFVA